MNFYQKLNSAWTTSNSALCVGLDPDLSKMPTHLRNDPLGIQKFCINIVDATADTVCAFKPQIAYFAAVGAEAQLQAVCDHVRNQYPHIVLILDAKRGDIGDTAALYAREAFERYQADAVTVNPYLGTDSLEPFLRTPNKGTIVLCRTSNEGSGQFHRSSSTTSPCTNTLRALQRTHGSTWATLPSWLAQPTQPNWPKFVPSLATCHYLSRALALKAATSTQWCAMAATRRG